MAPCKWQRRYSKGCSAEISYFDPDQYQEGKWLPLKARVRLTQPVHLAIHLVKATNMTHNLIIRIQWVTVGGAAHLTHALHIYTCTTLVEAWIYIRDKEANEQISWPTFYVSQGLVQHTSIPAGQGPLSGGRQALLAAVGEKLLISLADYFVISNSGFGRLPAVQGRRWNSIYTINPNQPRDCHLEGDSYEDLSRRLPGVRHFLWCKTSCTNLGLINLFNFNRW